jgi:hypothetical protein
MTGRVLVAGMAAILTASLVGTAILGILMRESDPFVLVPMLLMVIVFATAHFLLLGLPLAVLVAKRWRIGWWNSGLAGLTIGALPLPSLLLSGAPDLDGMVLLSALPLILSLAGAGLAGGLAFRAAWRDAEEGKSA